MRDAPDLPAVPVNGDGHLIAHVIPAGDGCQVVPRLTAQGQAVYDELFPLVAQINAELMTALSDADAARLDEALRRLQARAETMAAQADLPKADRRRGSAAST